MLGFGKPIQPYFSYFSWLEFILAIGICRGFACVWFSLQYKTIIISHIFKERKVFLHWKKIKWLHFKVSFLYLYLFYQESRHSAFRLTFFLWRLILTGPFLWVFWSTIFYVFEQLWFGMHDSRLLYYYSSPLLKSNILVL